MFSITRYVGDVFFKLNGYCIWNLSEQNNEQMIGPNGLFAYFTRIYVLYIMFSLFYSAILNCCYLY